MFMKYNLFNCMKSALIIGVFFGFLLCPLRGQDDALFSSGQECRGKLFIIGGGARPPELIADLIRLSGIGREDYIPVFPQASSIPDTAFYYTQQQFAAHGITRSVNYFFQQGATLSDAALDSVKAARLIYLPGGAQDQLMVIIGNTRVHSAIMEAYRNGAVIAGTSAGAAVMSRVMITGDEYKHPEYTGDFRTIEADNLVYAEGLGLLTSAIVDQHFIQRMRMNRLITAVLDHPGLTGIGIDESTALLVEGNKGTVYGFGQVIMLRHPSKQTAEQDGLLGGKGLILDVLLPGDTTLIQQRYQPVTSAVSVKKQILPE
jgi:cyanophycinase